MNHISQTTQHQTFKHVQLVLMDLDGSALNPEQCLTPCLIATLKQLKSRIPYTFISARSPHMMKAQCAQADISGPVVTLDGALILDWNSQRKLQSFPFPVDTALNILELLAKAQADFTVYTTEHGYFQNHTPRIERFYCYNIQAVRAGVLPMKCLFYDACPPITIAKEGILKIYIDGLSTASQEELLHELQVFSELRLDRTEKGSLSITMAQASKENAIHFLCEYLGMEPQNICSFGDYYNDMKMLQMTGYSVAMGNAPQAVKDCAKFVTCSNAEDGVAHFIQAHLLNP